MAYDPSKGTPSWYANGKGTAATQDEFKQQSAMYNQYLQQAGLADKSGGNIHSTTFTPGGGSYSTNSNTGQVSGNVTDFAKPVDIAGLQQKYTPKPVPSVGSSGEFAPAAPSFFGGTGSGSGYQQAAPGSMITSYAPGAQQGGYQQWTGTTPVSKYAPRTINLPDGYQPSRFNPEKLPGGSQYVPPTPGETGGFGSSYTPPSAPGQPYPVSTATSGSYQPGGTILTSFAPGSQSTIDPNNSLRNQQFLPGSTNNQYDQMALGALGNVNPNNQFSGLTDQSRQMILDRLQGLNGPDRTQLAREAFDIFQQQNEPRYQQELRGVGQKAAALGRIGAGLTTNELTDVFSQRNRDLDLLQRGLINDAAGQTLQDRLNTLNATLGGSQTLSGQDLGLAGLNAQNAFGLAGQYGQMGQQQFGRQQANYQQNAQERAYQDYLARTAVEDQIRQQQMQQQQAQAEWERQYAANQLAAQLAAQQNVGYPGIPQPGGDSYGTGVAAGTQAPVVNQPYVNPGPVLPPAQDPGSIFGGGVGIGLQDPRNRGDFNTPSVFGNDRLGLARAY